MDWIAYTVIWLLLLFVAGKLFWKWLNRGIWRS